MSRKWKPEAWAAFVKNEMPKAINAETNAKAIFAGLTEMENGMKLRIVEKNIVDTGATLSSVNHQVTKLDDNGAEGEAGPGTEYAIYHEFGTKKMRARPFMRPTIDEDKNIIAKAVMQPYSEAIKGLF